MNAPDTLKAFEEAAVRCRSNGGKCICDPACFDVCYVEAEVNEIDECALDHDRRAREEP